MGRSIELADRAGELSDEQWTRFAQSAQPTFRLEVRPTADRHTNLRYMVWGKGARVGNGQMLMHRMQSADEQYAFDDGPLVTAAAGGTELGGVSRQAGGGGGASIPLPEGLTPGKHHLRMVQRISLHKYTQSAFRSPFAVPPELASATYQWSGDFELLPPGERSIELTKRPSESTHIESVIKIPRIDVSHDGKEISVTVVLNGVLRMGIGFDVVALNGDKSIKIGSFAAQEGMPSRTSMTLGAIVSEFPTDVKEIDIQLRPSAAAAQGLEMFEIWDGDLIIPDVKIVRH